MARRRRGEEEHPFSLDAFLDIVANLVGILIRLIVMVGLSVRALPGPSHALRDAEKQQQSQIDDRRAEWERRMKEIVAENAKSEVEHQRRLNERRRELAARDAAEDSIRTKRKKLDRQYDLRRRAIAERLAVLHAFEKQAAELAGDVERLHSEKSGEAALFDRELAAAQRLELQVEEQSKTVAELRSDLEAAQRELDSERIKRESLDDQIDELRKSIAEIEAAPKPVRSLLHDATAVARRVEIGEVHYRIKNGRIAQSGMTDLLEMLKRKVRSAYDSNADAPDGMLGPVHGFTMHYELDRRASTLSMRAQTGVGAWDVDLKRFRLVAEHDELGESFADALQEGSTFFRSLTGVDPAKQVVTFWVYPDGFAAVKAVEQALHQRGFAVAMRPMPDGVDISGSPSGTTSDAR